MAWFAIGKETAGPEFDRGRLPVVPVARGSAYFEPFLAASAAFFSLLRAPERPFDMA